MLHASAGEHNGDGVDGGAEHGHGDGVEEKDDDVVS